MTAPRKFPVVTALCLLALTSVATAGPAHFTTINYPGAVSTFAYGINPAGDIVGGYVDSSKHEHGFVLSAGSFTSFDWPGSTWTEGWGINPQGDIVGQYGRFENGFNTVHGFLLRDGTFYPIDVPDQPNTMPVKISPEGTIVGCYHVGTPGGATILSTMHGWVRTADGFVSDPTAGTMHNGINPSGDIVGNLADPTTGAFLQSYIISNGVTSWFTVPGSVMTRAWDISPSGDVVGVYRDSAQHFHGFLLRDGTLTGFDVALPGVTQTRAFGTNAAGDIVGYYGDATGLHGFVLTKRGGE